MHEPEVGSRGRGRETLSMFTETNQNIIFESFSLSTIASMPDCISTSTSAVVVVCWKKRCESSGKDDRFLNRLMNHKQDSGVSCVCFLLLKGVIG